MPFDTTKGFVCDRCQKTIHPTYTTKFGRMKTDKTPYVSIAWVDHETPRASMLICPECEADFIALMQGFTQPREAQP